MALTTLVKDELASYDAPKISARKAEISTILRFTGGLHIVSGRIVVESEVDHEPTAHRMRRIISEIYGHDSELTSVTGGGLRRGGRYVVRVDQGGEALARQTGLLDVRGRPVRGLPPAVVNGSLQDAEAVMRGAFLAHGSLTEPGRSSALEFTCPGPEAALALVGAARRLDIIAKAREVWPAPASWGARPPTDGQNFLTLPCAVAPRPRGRPAPAWSAPSKFWAIRPPNTCVTRGSYAW